jgi:hypothetical protein
MRTFLRQPLAMSGLFFMFMAAVTLLSQLPLLGTLLAVALVPAATLGLMAATREAEQGRFPQPSLLIAAFRGPMPRRRAMLTLGALYAIGLLVVMGLSALFMGATPPPPPAEGAELTPAAVSAALDRPGLLAVMLVYVPLLMAFWHAPALVYWHGVAPAKSLFFSLLACWGNKGAMLVFVAGWAGVFMLTGLALSLIGSLFGGPQVLSVVVYPMVLIMASMFHTSLWFTFRDSFRFDNSAELPPAAPGAP